MKVYAANKTFNNEVERDAFVNEFVGDKKWYQIRPKYVSIDGLDVTVIVRCSKNAYGRVRILNDNGFDTQWVDV